jgi:hypothetical protein
MAAVFGKSAPIRFDSLEFTTRGVGFPADTGHINPYQYGGRCAEPEARADPAARKIAKVGIRVTLEWRRELG